MSTHKKVHFDGKVSRKKILISLCTFYCLLIQVKDGFGWENLKELVLVYINGKVVKFLKQKKSQNW